MKKRQLSNQFRRINSITPYVFFLFLLDQRHSMEKLTVAISNSKLLCFLKLNLHLRCSMLMRMCVFVDSCISSSKARPVWIWGLNVRLSWAVYPWAPRTTSSPWWTVTSSQPCSKVLNLSLIFFPEMQISAVYFIRKVLKCSMFVHRSLVFWSDLYWGMSALFKNCFHQPSHTSPAALHSKMTCTCPVLLNIFICISTVFLFSSGSHRDPPPHVFVESVTAHAGIYHANLRPLLQGNTHTNKYAVFQTYDEADKKFFI